MRAAASRIEVPERRYPTSPGARILEVHPPHHSDLVHRLSPWPLIPRTWCPADQKPTAHGPVALGDGAYVAHGAAHGAPAWAAQRKLTQSDSCQVHVMRLLQRSARTGLPL
jgi:hypothetical protein